MLVIDNNFRLLYNIIAVLPKNERRGSYEKSVFILASVLRTSIGIFHLGAFFAAAAEVVAYPVEGGNIYYDTTGTIVGTDWNIRAADIPSEIDGVTITSIADEVFFQLFQLKRITLPNTLTQIGQYAFYETGLKSINIPASVTSIGDGAFTRCKSLEGIWVDGANENYCNDASGVLYTKDKTTLLQCPGGYSGSYSADSGVSCIDKWAFSGCSKLTGITLPEKLQFINACAFYECTNLTNITIPKQVFFLGDSAFADCYQLTSVYFKGDAPTEMGTDVFSEYYTSKPLSGLTLYYLEGASGWTSPTWHGYPTDTWGQNPVVAYPVTGGNIYFDKETGAVTKCDWGVTAADIPDRIDGVAVTSIGDSAFQYNGRLTSVTLPSSLKSIGEAAFSDCSTLTSVTIPDGVESIGELAYYGCSSLTRITLPSTVREIGRAAFADCSKLEAVCLYGNAPKLGESAFDGTAAGFTLYYLEGKSGWTSPYYSGYPTATWLGYVDVPNNAWYYTAVAYALKNGLMNGMSATTFEPDTAMTRAMLVTVLWRYAGEPMEGENTFTDVPAGQWYTDAVAWAAHNGIVGGVGDNKFDPNGNITREQMATILYRYASGQDIDTSARADLSGFPDAGNVSSYAEDAMKWAVAEGLVNGSDGKLLPQGNATRAQVATILMRFIENVVK